MLCDKHGKPEWTCIECMQDKLELVEKELSEAQRALDRMLTNLDKVQARLEQVLRGE